MQKHIAAYVRKSNRADESAAAQLEAIRDLARRDGIHDLEVYSDVGVSGRYGKRGERSAWRRLQDDIEEGRVEAVYLSVLDRAGRSLEEWLGFARRCRDRGVRIVDQTGQDRAADEGYDLTVMEMLFAEREGKKAVERARRGMVTKAARGDVSNGQPPFGFMIARDTRGRVIHVPNPDEGVDVVIAAVRETGGNVLAATRLLNERGVKARRAVWSPKSVAKIVRRYEPKLARTLARPRTQLGVLRPPPPLAKIVRCHCGGLMTPRPKSNGLYCYAGIKLGKAHGRYVGRASHVYEFLRAETEGRREVKGRTTYTSDPEDLAARKVALEEELRRLGKTYRVGAVDDEEFESETRRIRSDLDVIEDDINAADEPISLTFTAHGPVIHWDELESDPDRVGDELRRLVREVRLDTEMKPIVVEWRRTIRPFTPKAGRPAIR